MKRCEVLGLVLLASLVSGAEGAAAVPVQVELKIIHAHNKNKDIDARIQSLAKQLSKLSFTGYQLKDQAVFELDLGAAGRMQLPNGEWMVVKPLAMEADGMLKVELSVDKLKFKTMVAIAAGATLVVGGPPFEGGALIVAMSRAKDGGPH
ncbi:MAG: hypothetical protein HY903_14060 [Deltaproteobacteria bacterium]|nr:hypothetical protein [Deltaproteobacteria bacterium]